MGQRPIAARSISKPCRQNGRALTRWQCYSNMQLTQRATQLRILGMEVSESNRPGNLPRLEHSGLLHWANLSYAFMRLGATLVIFPLTFSAALALDNNNPETWCSPNNRYAIKEAFYGEGKRVIAVFVSLSTGRSEVIDSSGARNSSALWSPDSHYVAINFERSHNWGDVGIYRVERGRISEVKLPSGMEAPRFLPSPAKDPILHVGPQAIRALRWLGPNRIELVSETAGAGLYRDGDAPEDEVSVDVEIHFIIELSGRTAKIIKSYEHKGA
jgi:hypothetical protein